MSKPSQDEKAQRVWQASLRDAWLRDHPGKTVDDYELAGSCGDTAKANGLSLNGLRATNRMPRPRPPHLRHETTRHKRRVWVRARRHGQRIRLKGSMTGR